MIISHKHKFIFIKTEKTAGTSLEIALSKICGPDDVITKIRAEDEAYRQELGYRGPQNYYIPLKVYNWKDVVISIYKRRFRKFDRHESAIVVKERIPEDIWNSYYKFCFERNPWDKVISWYYWRGYNKRYDSILEYIKAGKAGGVRGFSLYSKNAVPIVDKIYKYEELDAALKDLSEKLNLETPIEMPKKKLKGDTRKDKKHYSEVLTKEEADWISMMFAREIKLLNYKFENKTL